MAATRPSSSLPPGAAHFQATADLQLGSVLFGRLPAEIREMIYEQCWIASGLRQHIFQEQQDGEDYERLRHSPCEHPVEGQLIDERNQEFEPIWRTARRRSIRGGGGGQSSSAAPALVNEKWAARLSCPWNDHWKCHEAMMTRKATTLFLPMLLSCKRTYLEAYHSLYSSLTFTFTDLSTAAKCLPSPPSSPSFSSNFPTNSLSPSPSPSPSSSSLLPTPLLHSLTFSLSLPFQTLHQHHHHRTESNNTSSDSTSPSSPGPWADLCTTLSDMVRFGSLSSVTIRLDISDSEACWWNVRERWILAPVRGMLARRLRVQLPGRTFDPGWLRGYQYGGGVGGEGEEDSETPFLSLERYDRLRWTGGGGVRKGGGGMVVPRYEFIRPGADHHHEPVEDGGNTNSHNNKRDRARRSLMDLKDSWKLRRGSLAI